MSRVQTAGVSVTFLVKVLVTSVCNMGGVGSTAAFTGSCCYYRFCCWLLLVAVGGGTGATGGGGGGGVVMVLA
ncbi:hypothetical protein M0802_000281 [Mischocyttarus mexicanus]|nr:hypothetical protein M0802_000281 [Mischocyttarus mexicanus]